MDDPQAPIDVGLRQPATAALASYLNDHRGFLSFNAYLWKTIVIAQYGRGGPPTDSPQLPPGPTVVEEMDEHTQFLGQMLFCRGVDSFLVYLSDLLTLIFTAEPNIGLVRNALAPRVGGLNIRVFAGCTQHDYHQWCPGLSADPL